MNATPLKRGLATVTLSALLTLAVGCGSDNNNPTASKGSPSDPAFLEVQPQVNTFLDSVFVAFSAGLSSYNEVPISDGQIKKFYGPIIPGGTNQSTYEYTTDGWHHITLAVNNDVIVLGINDSIQFKNGQTVQQSSNGADALDYRHHWRVTQVNQNADFTNLSGDIGIMFNNLNAQNTIISGSYAYTVNQHTLGANSVLTDNNFTFTSSAADVSVVQPSSGVWGSGCPSSGVVSFSVAQEKIVTDGTAIDTTTITWSGSASFANGTATVSVSDGTSAWGYNASICNRAL